MAKTPDKFCDIVMKGGITSGVAYPLAVCELAKAYRFKNIGGTSTGAIAAAFTAASEYGRDARHGGFEEMAKLPAWFGRKDSKDRRSNLFSLFQPEPSTAPLFKLFAVTLRGRRFKILRYLRLSAAVVRNFPVRVLIGASPGLALAAIDVMVGTGALSIAAFVGAALLVVAGVAASVGERVVRLAQHTIPRNFYGLCTGYRPPNPKRSPPLATWVSETIDRLAGRDPETEPPLTFGDLWGEDEERYINLEVVTTNLTQGRPLRLPFLDPDEGHANYRQFYFHPDEFRQFFPPRIVDWMIDHASVDEEEARFAPLLPLPRAADMPLVVAVRMSLSYPILLSAVPLYAIDYTRPFSETDRRPERCWFSDGGLTTNFPVHFFDQPLPRWPTFAINLRPAHPDWPDEEVWMPRHNKERGVTFWRRFEPIGGRGTLLSFLGAVKDVTMNWMDNEQTRVPGYRERVVHISLRPQEGGANIDMPGPVVESLADRGRRAGRMLAERFATGPAWAVGETWENHRWVRYRSTMHVVEEMLKQMRDSYQAHVPGERSYEQLIRRKRTQPPLGYPWYNTKQQRFAITTTESVVKLVDKWTEEFETFGKAAPDDPGPPRPNPVLRIVPRI